MRIGNDEMSVEVSPLGAEMQAVATSDGRNWLWNGDAAFWGGRSPVLFPMVGKAPNDKVTIEGKAYTHGPAWLCAAQRIHAGRGVGRAIAGSS